MPLAGNPFIAPRVQHLARNERGRDFCVGDIHGMFTLLDKLLNTVNFNPDLDRLLSVGDLVDRGPESPKALIYLNQPWFHAIRGNHEDMLLGTFENPNDPDTIDLWRRNGGDWWWEQSPLVQRMLYRWLKTLPLALEVETTRGLVGIVHADLPAQYNWGAFTDKLAEDDPDAIAVALWSRQRARLHKIAGKVPDVAAIYCGHTVVNKPLAAGNVHFIDTGACYTEIGSLTIVDIGEGPDSAVSLAAR
ncbi:MAG: metallophosphoesterase [Burkholderiales bacterium]